MILLMRCKACDNIIDETDLTELLDDQHELCLECYDKVVEDLIEFEQEKINNIIADWDN